MLGSEYVEYIHDYLVARLWPDSDPISTEEYRSRELLESAVARPFHSAFGQDAYPTIIEKSAALFHSLISNHPFNNGNKRTAVMAFDMFLVANGYFALVNNDGMYKLAEQTASCNERRLSAEECLKNVFDAVRDWIVDFTAVKRVGRADPKISQLYSAITKARRKIRANSLNTRLKE